MPATWHCGSNGPKTINELRKTLRDKIKGKNGQYLIANKFIKDHIFTGHTGDVQKLGQQLAKLRSLPKSTILLSPLTQTANREILNWIDKIPDNKLSLAGNTWTISHIDSTVPMVNKYNLATVDLASLKQINRDDVKKKSRKWLKESKKTPKLACQFNPDGMPQIYHLDF